MAKKTSAALAGRPDAALSRAVGIDLIQDKGTAARVKPYLRHTPMLPLQVAEATSAYGTSSSSSNAAVDYVRAGWALCAIPRGKKGPVAPGWQRRERAITTPEQAKRLTENVGLCHAWSGTCAIDIDRYDVAKRWLADRGIDLDALLSAPDSVQIASGRPGRGKLLYRLATPLPSVQLAPYNVGEDNKTFHALEFRCAARNGNTVQDVLPPSIHPETGRPYAWKYGNELVADWRYLPELPSELLALWRDVLGPSAERDSSKAPTGAAADEIRAILEHHDPDAPYEDWVRVGMALHHETSGSDEGLALWDEWSSQGAKYRGAEDLESHWRSFGDHPNPVTLASLLPPRVASPDDFDTVDAVPESAARPIIMMREGELHRYAPRAEALLADEVYVRNHSLVRIAGAADLNKSQTHGVQRDAAQPVILPATTEYIRRKLSARARFAKPDPRKKSEDGFRFVDCPVSLAKNITEQGEWETFQPLTAIATAPFLRDDFTVCDTPGYDAASCVFYVPNGSFPPIPAEPTRDDALAALRRLLEPFEEFPYATVASRSAFVSHVLTEAVRVAIPTSPLFWYIAPGAGYGKSLLSEMACRIVHGQQPAQRAWVEGDELRKVLFSLLLVGDRSALFDNVPRGIKVRSSHLAAFATAPAYSDRVLGASDVRALPNKTVISLSGINITPTGELARRSIVVRLDLDLEPEKAKQRRFKIRDLRSYVARHRGELLAAALTIVRAYVAAGAPEQAVPLPSFELWSQLARDPLLWLGQPDPVETQEDETDDESGAEREAFRALVELFGEEPFTSAGIVERLTLADLTSAERLAEALRQTGCRDPLNARYVGYWLRDHRDAVRGGWKLVQNKKTEAGAVFRFVRRGAPSLESLA